MLVVCRHHIIEEPRLLFFRGEVGRFNRKATADSTSSVDANVACLGGCHSVPPCLRNQLTPRKLPLLKGRYNSVCGFVGDDEEVSASCEDAVAVGCDLGAVGLLCEVAVKGIVRDDLARCERRQELDTPLPPRRSVSCALNARQREQLVEWCIVARMAEYDGGPGEVCS